MHRTWSFDDGTQVAHRILREYADRLLRELPHVDDDTLQPAALSAGYRWLTEAMVSAARRYHRAIDPNVMTAVDVLVEGALASREARRQEAKAARAAWDVMHRHLVALKLGALMESDAAGGPLELVLLAEQAVEELAVGIDAYWA
jgi:hypothetical protein